MNELKTRIEEYLVVVRHDYNIAKSTSREIANYNAGAIYAFEKVLSMIDGMTMIGLGEE